MKMDLPCDVIKDLLPSYIDGLTGETSTKSVAAHLKSCDGCQKLYQDMKQSYSQDSVSLSSQDGLSSRDKAIVKKINRKVKKKVKLAIALGLILVILTVGIGYLLVEVPLKKLSWEDVAVSVDVYPMADLITDPQFFTETETNADVQISKENTEEESVRLQIPDGSQADIYVSKDMAEENGYLSVVSWKSPYFLRTILWDMKTAENSLYVKGYRTTFLNNQAPSSAHITTTLEFRRLDKIIYVHKDGSETILWENRKSPE